jgi:hypothetical protein
MVNNYVPKPIDTSAVEVEGHLVALTELLANHAHDLWALQRLSEGWTWGPTRCDTARTHPCLVPYEDLPESEKEYDRNTLGTIRAVIACGYRITIGATDRES